MAWYWVLKKLPGHFTRSKVGILRVRMFGTEAVEYDIHFNPEPGVFEQSEMADVEAYWLRWAAAQYVRRTIHGY